MQIHKTFNKAHIGASKLFLRQASSNPVYVFMVRLERKEFFAVFSNSEVKTCKLPIKKAYYTVGNTESSQEMKKEVQRFKDNPNTKRLQLLCESGKSFMKLQESMGKLEKLERDGKPQNQEDAESLAAEALQD